MNDEINAYIYKFVTKVSDRPDIFMDKDTFGKMFLEHMKKKDSPVNSIFKLIREERALELFEAIYDTHAEKLLEARKLVIHQRLIKHLSSNYDETEITIQHIRNVAKNEGLIEAESFLKVRGVS